MDNLRLILSSFDSSAVDKTVTDILDVTRANGIAVVGPIPLPTKVDKFSYQQIKHVNHKRLLDLVSTNKEVIMNLVKMNIPNCVNIEMKEF